MLGGCKNFRWEVLDQTIDAKKIRIGYQRVRHILNKQSVIYRDDTMDVYQVYSAANSSSNLYFHLGAMFSFHVPLPIVFSSESSLFPIFGVLATYDMTDKRPDFLMDVVMVSLHIFVGLEASSANVAGYRMSVRLLMTAGMLLVKNKK